MEGNSDVAKRNNNPGNLKDKDGNFRKFKTTEEGRKAVIDQLNSWKTRYPNWSVHDLNSRYAPDKSSGGDNPDGTVDGRDQTLLAAVR